MNTLAYCTLITTKSCVVTSVPSDDESYDEGGRCR
jgi:hypothetical protein